MLKTFALLLGSLLLVASIASAVTGEWTIYTKPEIQKELPDNAAVATFLKTLVPELDAVDATVGEYEITSLGTDISVQLIATVDVSGRELYHSIYIVCNTGDIKVTLIRLPGENITDLKQWLVGKKWDPFSCTLTKEGK